MTEMQKEMVERIEKLLTEVQRKEFKEMRDRAANVPGGPGGSMPKGPGGSGPGGLFRAYRYPADFPGFKGEELKPGVKIEEIDLKK